MSQAPPEPLPDGLLEALERAAAHPCDPDAALGLQHVQTHISHVFLSATRVYKLRKAVRLGFLDFGTRAARNADCLREVELNRRLAPDVYLGVAALRRAEGSFRVDPPGDGIADASCEHCVVMRRLPDGRDALSLLARGALRLEQLDAVAERLARFHEAHRLGRPAPFSAEEWLARITAPVEENFRSLAEEGCEGIDPGQVARTSAAARGFLDERAGAFEERRTQGMAVDGHGDLHLEHVFFETDAAPPLLIDCIEFREDFRRIDAAADAAFLAMDLLYRGHPRLAARFLARYARDTDDYGLFRVIDYYVSYRAAVRAKVAAIAASEPELEPDQRKAAAGSAARHLDLAERTLQGGRPAALVLVAGVVGSGKSSAAEVLAESLGGVVVSSDRVRKRQAGLAPTARTGDRVDAGLYTAKRTEAVYRGLLERAAPVLDGGRVAILDATFSRATHRGAARRFAHERGLPLRIFETRCPPAFLRERLERRKRVGADPSDAGPELLQTSLARWEPIAASSPEEHQVVDTHEPDWRRRLADAAQALLPAQD